MKRPYFTREKAEESLRASLKTLRDDHTIEAYLGKVRDDQAFVVRAGADYFRCLLWSTGHDTMMDMTLLSPLEALALATKGKKS